MNPISELFVDTKRSIKLFSDIYLSTIADKKHKPRLLLIGSYGSPFLRSVNKMAKEVGINSRIMNHLPPVIGNCKVVVDKETCSTVTALPAKADVDRLYNPGTSCVMEAVYCLLHLTMNLKGKNITIVGRGHAVQGLAERLLSENATVTVAHSYTKDLYEAMHDRDIVVLATPTISDVPRAKLVLDIGGALTQEQIEELPTSGIYEKGIGKLTNAILLSRVAGTWVDITGV